jgi:hypothetical protein
MRSNLLVVLAFANTVLCTNNAFLDKTSAYCRTEKIFNAKQNGKIPFARDQVQRAKKTSVGVS